MDWKRSNSVENGLQHEVLLDRKWGVLVSEARSRREGGPARSRLIGVGLRNLIVDPWRIFSGSGGWEKEKSYENLNRLEKRADRCQHGRG